MPNVRDSSGTIGTTWRPICLSRTRVLRIRMKAIVVETSRSPVPLSCESNASSGGTWSGSPPPRGARRGAPPRPPPPGGGAPAGRLGGPVKGAHPRAAVVRLVERALGALLVGERQLEAVAEGEQRA